MLGMCKVLLAPRIPEREHGETHVPTKSATYVITQHCVTHYYHCHIAGNSLLTPKRWIACLAKAHVYMYNLFRVLTRLNPKNGNYHASYQPITEIANTFINKTSVKVNLLIVS